MPTNDHDHGEDRIGSSSDCGLAASLVDPRGLHVLLSRPGFHGRDDVASLCLDAD